jgi:hypothetical protein
MFSLSCIGFAALFVPSQSFSPVSYPNIRHVSTLNPHGDKTSTSSPRLPTAPLFGTDAEADGGTEWIKDAMGEEEKPPAPQPPQFSQSEMDEMVELIGNGLG